MMETYADPRAVAIQPLWDWSDAYALVDASGNKLASAIGYHDETGRWWGVCSHRSGIPIDKRASTPEEAASLLKTTVWMFRIGVEQDEFEGFDGFSRRNVLYIRSLPDEEVLEAARSSESLSWKRVAKRIGGSVNPAWITSRCAEVAYMRGVMDAQEMDWITR